MLKAGRGIGEILIIANPYIVKKGVMLQDFPELFAPG